MLVMKYSVNPDVRQVGDAELLRCFPGWVCIMFHRAVFDTVSLGYRLAYTVQRSTDVDDSQVVYIEVFQGRLIEGRPRAWRSAGQIE
jgi:hypothetical protein